MILVPILSGVSIALLVFALFCAQKMGRKWNHNIRLRAQRRLLLAKLARYEGSNEKPPKAHISSFVSDATPPFEDAFRINVAASVEEKLDRINLKEFASKVNFYEEDETRGKRRVNVEYHQYERDDVDSEILNDRKWDFHEYENDPLYLECEDTIYDEEGIIRWVKGETSFAETQIEKPPLPPKTLPPKTLPSRPNSSPPQVSSVSKQEDANPTKGKSKELGARPKLSLQLPNTPYSPPPDVPPTPRPEDAEKTFDFQEKKE